MIKGLIYNNDEEIYTSDTFGEVSHNFTVLEATNITWCFMKKSENLDKFFDSLSTAKNITKLRLNDLKYHS